MDKKIKSTAIDFLSGGGEMGERIRAFDWSQTSLGPVEFWPRSLKTCVQIMLTSRQPIWIGWGKELIKLYNDPYKDIVRGKHPWALGKPASVVWSEIWKDIDPLLKKVMHDNEGTYVEAQLLIMERNGYPEETHYTFSYTPVAGDEGVTEGMICANVDDTDRIISNRQLQTLTQLGKSLAHPKNDEEVFQRTIDTIALNPYDFPFALLYEISGSSAQLVNSTNIQNYLSVVPSAINLESLQEVAMLAAKAVTERRPILVDDLIKAVGIMPGGAWAVPPGKGIILPIAQRQRDPYGFLVLGANPYRLVDEKYTSFVELISDLIVTSLTNVHALEDERKQLEAMAEIDRAKTTFFSNISHEFRTPLTLFLGPLEDLLNDPEIKNNNRERVQVAFRNAQRMQKLVNLLLDFSRIEAGRMEANFTPVDIASFTEELVSNFRSAVEKAGMDLIFHAEKISDPVYVDIDMWEKIILNLLSNAFKYSEEGSIEVSITTDNNHIVLSVKDTGVGIPEADIEKIFERFHRVQNVKGRTQEGTGIGLAMVKELVKIHQGQISVQSELGKGSVFTVRIPFGTSHAGGKNSESHKVVRSQSSAYIEEALQWIPKENGTVDFTSAVGKTNTKRYTILLADDNADMRKYVQRLFDAEYNVLVANDGEDAYSKALQHIPDLILSDIMMPRLDGFGLLKRLKNTLSTRNIPVIFLSARAGEEARVEGLQAGADDYLTKPFSSKELVARVANRLAIATARRYAEKEIFNLFLQSPAHIHVFKGPEHRVEFFHPLGRRVIGKDITGLKIREALPELERQGFFEMLDKVYRDGVTIHVNSTLATLPDQEGKPRQHYFDITYLPWRDMEGKIQGVLQFSFEVTDAVKQRLKAEANEVKFRSIAQQSPVAMALLMGPSHIVEVANDRVLHMWGKTQEQVLGKPVLEIFPEIVQQGFGELLSKVFATGEPFVANEVALTFQRHGETEEISVNLLYEPFRNEKGEIEGIVAVGTDVTEQVHARNKVAEAELKFRTIIEQTPSPLCIFRGEEMVLEVANDAALAVWQVGREVLGKRLVDIVPEMLRQPFLNLMLDVYHNGVTRFGYEAPAYFIRKNGQRDEAFFNFTYVPYRDVNDSIIGVLILATDVTEQVLAKKRLIENEERLRIATKILGLGTWEYDPINDLFLCSEKTIELFGLDSHRPIKIQDILDTIIEEDRNRVVDNLNRALSPGSDGNYDVEYTLINKAEKMRHTIRANGQAFFDNNGKPYRAIGTVLDITDRKKAEEEIKASEARFRLLATSIPQIVWTNDQEGHTTFVSVQFEKFTGINPENAYDSWRDLIHPADKEKIIACETEALENGVGWQEEFRLRNKNEGSYRWFLGNSNPLKDTTGDIMMWVGSASDIQNLKEQSRWLEEQVHERTRALKELNQSLKISNEDLQQFAHVASHDLKEPIRKIKTFSNRLQDDYKSVLPEKANNFISKILSATDRMYAMIDGVLSYSTTTSLEQPKQSVDLNEVMKHIQTDLEVPIVEKGATIITEPLPIVYGAPVLLYQLFYNLINNALKFSHTDKAPLVIIKSYSVMIDDKPFVKIVLADNGIGFNQEDAEKIFTTFTRLNSKDKYEGTGLGLALCKKIVQRHNGYIYAYGEKNAGAQFTVLLPIK